MTTSTAHETAPRKRGPIAVLVVADQSVFWLGVRQVLAQAAELTLVGEVVDGPAALAVVDQLVPEVVFCDYHLPGLDGIEVARRLKQRHPHLALVIVALSWDDAHLFAALRAGASACVTRAIAGPDLVATLLAARRGQYPINEHVMAEPQLVDQVLATFRAHERAAPGTAQMVFAPLTAREVEILGLVADGYANKVIARRLGTSDQTVKNQISGIMRKLAVNDRTQAVVQALRQGWLTLPAGDPER